MKKPKIILAADHAGFLMKEGVKDFLIERGFHITDVGAHEYNAEDDYPEFMAKAGTEIATDTSGDVKGIIFGGSGQGEAMVANRFPGVRAAVWYGESEVPKDEEAAHLDVVQLSREHNDANVLSIGARFVTLQQAEEAILRWLGTSFSNESKHQRRIDQIDSIE